MYVCDSCLNFQRAPFLPLFQLCTLSYSKLLVQNGEERKKHLITMNYWNLGASFKLSKCESKAPSLSSFKACCVNSSFSSIPGLLRLMLVTGEWEQMSHNTASYLETWNPPPPSIFKYEFACVKHFCPTTTLQSFLPWKRGGEGQARDLKLQATSNKETALWKVLVSGMFMTWGKKKQTLNCCKMVYNLCISK